MARAMNALCEILPAKRMWSLGGEKQWNLPISAQDQSTSQGGLRKRISSFSMSYSARSDGNSTRSGGNSSWPFQRSQSMPTSGSDSASLKKWVEWGWGWITRKKNILCRKISICDDEDLMLGDRRSALNQAFCKVRAHFRKLVHRGPVRHEGFTYDSFNYAQNFDDGSFKDKILLMASAILSSLIWVFCFEYMLGEFRVYSIGIDCYCYIGRSPRSRIP